MRILVALLALPFVAAAQPGDPVDSLQRPGVPREFRALWIATVRNMDWPSRSDLTPDEQQQELLAILDRAASLNMNAIVLQVRPEADALYASRYEPWSRYLTGEQGKAPEPAWDPLRFAIDEAHKRGLELHAWFNPYRAAYRRSEPAARSHVSRRRADLVVPYGPFLWMDPGIPEVRRLMIRTVLDVVRRYDVDGVHIDDYFYPYPERSASGRKIEFPDNRSYAAYRRGGGRLDRSAWRRRNVDLLVREFYSAVKGAKSWVKVGVSPFGIWRPRYPFTIRSGVDAYEDLFADARRWIREGWLDYAAPQLYWPVQPAEQSYPVLLEWWVEQSVKGRHVFPGLALFKISSNGRGMSPDDIVQQILITRDNPGATGHIHFNARPLMENVEGVADRLAELYAEPALPPASPWLDTVPPSRPIASAERDTTAGEILVRFAPHQQEAVSRWVIQWRVDGEWRSAILPGPDRRLIFEDEYSAVELISVAAVDRNANISVAAVVRPR